MEAKLQAALKRIQEIEEENKKLRERIIAFEEECVLRDGDETLLYDENQKLKKENKKLKVEKIEMEKNWEEEDEQLGKIIYELKNEVKELKQRGNSLENNNDDDDTIYPEAETEDEAEWFDLKVDNDYEIKNIFPYEIRKKSNGKVVKEGVNKNGGYVKVNLGNKKTHSKHILVAKHFIPNPNHLPIVDHKNHIRTDYHTSNLRWVSARDNSRNKYGINGIAYEYVDDIPDDAMKIEYYDVKDDRRYFEPNQYYYYYDSNSDEDKFYGRITENTYRILNIKEAKGGNKYVNMQDMNRKVVALMINRFKYQQGLTY